MSAHGEIWICDYCGGRADENGDGRQWNTATKNHTDCESGRTIAALRERLREARGIIGAVEQLLVTLRPEDYDKGDLEAARIRVAAFLKQEDA